MVLLYQLPTGYGIVVGRTHCSIIFECRLQMFSSAASYDFHIVISFVQSFKSYDGTVTSLVRTHRSDILIPHSLMVDTVVDNRSCSFTLAEAWLYQLEYKSLSLQMRFQMSSSRWRLVRCRYDVRHT